LVKHSKAVIFLNGGLADLSRVKKHLGGNSLLIGCDGGTGHILALGYKPDVVIGDFDSFTASAGGGTTYIRYPADKDFTDSELAVRYAAKAGCREIILAGLLGDRLDHLLGNIFLLNKREFAKIKLKIIEGNQEAYVVRGHAKIDGQKGDIISFMPIDGHPEVQTTGGLKYDLGKHKLSRQGNLGISNVLLRQTVEITVSKGSLLVIHQFAGGNRSLDNDI
jgi:thiamine pyrophosphokinase